VILSVRLTSEDHAEKRENCARLNRERRDAANPPSYFPSRAFKESSRLAPSFDKDCSDLRMYAESAISTRGRHKQH
jgi:hypothetical protein